MSDLNNTNGPVQHPDQSYSRDLIGLNNCSDYTPKLKIDQEPLQGDAETKSSDNGSDKEKRRKELEERAYKQAYEDLSDAEKPGVAKVILETLGINKACEALSDAEQLVVYKAIQEAQGKGSEKKTEDADLEIMPRYIVRDWSYVKQKREPIKYLIDELVEEASLNIWVGKWGSKKTWAALSAAVCVATGKEWLDRKTIQGNVLIIDEESGDRRLSDRLMAAAAGELITEDLPIEFISLASFNLLKNSQDQDMIMKEIVNRKINLVIIDALVDIMAGGDENAVKDTQPVFVALRRIAKTTNVGVVVIHHANRVGDYRGSSAIPGSLETMIQIDSKEGSDFISFKSLKMRDSEPVKFGARAVWADGQFYLTAAGDITEKTILTKSQQFTLDYFTENGSAKFTDLLDFAGDLYTENTLRKSIQYLVNNKSLARLDNGGRRTEAVYGIPKK